MVRAHAACTLPSKVSRGFGIKYGSRDAIALAGREGGCREMRGRGGTTRRGGAGARCSGGVREGGGSGGWRSDTSEGKKHFYFS